MPDPETKKPVCDSCEKCVACVKSDKANRKQCITEIYNRNFSIFWTQKKKWQALSHEEVLSCYNDAILAFVAKIDSGNFKVENKNSCKAFIARVMNNKCSDFYRANKKPNLETRELFDTDVTNEGILDGVDMELIKRCMRKLDDKCRRIIYDWLRGVSMADIADLNGLKNANVAAVSKKRCIDKLRKCLKEEGLI